MYTRSFQFLSLEKVKCIFHSEFLWGNFLFLFDKWIFIVIFSATFFSISFFFSSILIFRKNSLKNQINKLWLHPKVFSNWIFCVCTTNFIFLGKIEKWYVSWFLEWKIFSLLCQSKCTFKLCLKANFWKRKFNWNYEHAEDYVMWFFD